MKKAIWILWPSFVVAIAAVGLFFSLFDPADLHFFGEPVDLGRTTVYTLGFRRAARSARVPARADMTPCAF
jgi:hypothetical protein